MRGVGLLSAVLVSGTPGVHVAQTVRFLRLIALPPRPLEFKAFLAQNRALAEVWRTCTLQTMFLPTGSALGALGPKSLHYYNIFRVHISETTIKTRSKLELFTLVGTFELLAGVL